MGRRGTDGDPGEGNSSTTLWNLVPQIFFDLIGRFMPGFVFLFGLVMIVVGPSHWESFLITSRWLDNYLNTWSFLIVVILSYVSADLLYQATRFAFGDRIDKRKKVLDNEAVSVCFRQHGRIDKALGRSLPELPTDISINMLHDYLRIHHPEESSRLLKLRAERRYSLILSVGFVALAAVNTVLMAFDPVASRAAIDAGVLIAAALCYDRSEETYRRYVMGVCSAWLCIALSSCGK